MKVCVCVFSWPHTRTTKQIRGIRSAAERWSFSPAAARTTCDNRVIVGRQMVERPLDSPIVGGMK